MNTSSLTRIYINQSLQPNQIIIMDGDNYHYLTCVIRLKAMDQLKLFNSTDGEFIAHIIAINKVQITVMIDYQIRAAHHEPELTLAMCIIKTDRMADAIRSAVQIGITRFIPVVAQRCQYKQVTKDRLDKIVISSVQQSGRFILTEVTSEVDIKALCQMPLEQIIFASEHESCHHTIKTINITQHPTVLIGPEGGFTAQEAKLIASFQHIVPVSLGANILRAETAATAALACVQMMQLKTITTQN